MRAKLMSALTAMLLAGTFALAQAAEGSGCAQQTAASAKPCCDKQAVQTAAVADKGACPKQALQAAAANCPATTAAECEKLRASGQCEMKGQCDLQKTTAQLNRKALSTVYAAAESGDFSKVEACPVSRETLKKLANCPQFNAESQKLVLAVLDGKDQFSHLSACQATRAELKKAVAEYALEGNGVDGQKLALISTAAQSGDFSKVKACAETRATLLKVAGSYGCETGKQMLQTVTAAVESGDFSKVEGCKVTREKIQQAVAEYRDKSVQTALNQ